MGEYLFKTPTGVYAVFSTHSDVVVAATRDLEVLRQGLRMAAIEQAAESFDATWDQRVERLEQNGTTSFIGCSFDDAAACNYTGPGHTRLNKEDFLAHIDKMADEKSTLKQSHLHKSLVNAGFNWDLSETDGLGQIVIYTGLTYADGKNSDDPEIVDWTEPKDEG